MGISDDYNNGLPIPEIKVRDYQEECTNAILKGYSNGVTRGVISMPMGMGKTITMGHLIANLQEVRPEANKILILAHRKEIVEQNAEKIGWLNPDKSIGIEQAETYSNEDDEIISASVMTLGRKGSQRLLHLNPEDFKAVITDEVHHATEHNQSYQTIFDHFGISEPGSPILSIGFSATVKRADGVGLEKNFDEILYHKSILEAIQDKWLVDIRARRVLTDLDISDIGGKNDFILKDLEARINIKERTDVILKAWREFCEGQRKSTMIFCVDVAHGEGVTEYFKENGVDARCIFGKTNKQERAEILNDFKEQKFPILVNCAVFTEGTDIPCIDCIIMARPTKSPVFYQQSIGRGLRLFDTKEDCLVLDVVDTCKSNTLMTIPTLIGLKEDFDAEGESIIRIDREMAAAINENPAAIEAENLDDARQIMSEQFNPFALSDEWDEGAGQMSGYRWMNNNDTYYCEVPKYGHLILKQNIIGNWELTHHKPEGEKSIVRTRNELAIAFQAADSYIKNDCSVSEPLMNPKAFWRNLPPSDKQHDLARKFRVSIPTDLNRGQASDFLGKKIRQTTVYKKAKMAEKNRGRYMNVNVGKIYSGSNK